MRRSAPTRRRGRADLSIASAHPRSPARARRVVLRAAARGGGRRLSRRDSRRVLESRLARPGHQRHLPCAARVHPHACERVPAPRGARPRSAGVPLAPPRAALRRRPMDAGRPWDGSGAASGQNARRDEMGSGDGAAAAGAPRRADAGGGRRRGDCRRLRHRLSRAEGDGRKWPRPARLLRRGPRRDAVCAARCARPAPIAARRADEPEVVVLAATDPANPYGATLKWPAPRSTRQHREPAETFQRGERNAFCVDCRERCGQGADTLGRRHGDSRRRRAGGLSCTRRSAAPYVSPGSRAGIFARGESGGACAHPARTQRHRRAARHAHRGDRRHPAGRPPARAVPRERGICGRSVRVCRYWSVVSQQSALSHGGWSASASASAVPIVGVEPLRESGPSIRIPSTQRTTIRRPPDKRTRTMTLKSDGRALRLDRHAWRG